MDRTAFVAAPRHDLVDHFALKQTQIGTFLDDAVNNVAATPFKLRAQAIMQRYRSGLSFDRHANLMADRLLNVENDGRVPRMDDSSGVATLQSVHASDRQDERA